jgi:hypothetical protein
MGMLFLRRSAGPLLLGCGVVLGLGPAWAAKAPVKVAVKAAVKAAPTNKTATQKLPSSVRFIDSPSSEKPAARERRLKRECKGRPNAGMCLGYTR